ncbi:MAG: type II/IV secretion system protein, partial [Candidatus Eisenbacteria bacterium]|nr:type II/IV secretion system protein [Candidatus Eisenbacteria bacterium]
IVLRVLDSSKVQVSLDSLGFTPEVLRTWRDLIRLPSGVILVTGPTGSGKTTTLYGSLHEINIPEANISTLEDPVEYKLPRVQQVQVNPRTNMTFAAGLRALLRQDPDIIMVGEIRDLETADMAIRAAHTGHLVFSTLHTNEAASTVVRLTHMGVEPFMIAGSVRAILAQRLLRRLCRSCRVEEKTDPALLRRLVGAEEDAGPFYSARGCDHCRQSGYFGRVGVYELMVISEPLRQKMIDNVGLSEIRAAAQAEGMITLRDDAIAKARKGVTSLDEVSRVAMVSS